MDISDFKTFLEVYRTRHFGQAARNLFITQSTVSARIRNLEEQLGVRLFVRERNNIQLTPEGEKLVQYAETIVTSWTRVRQEIGAASAGGTSLILGGVPGIWDSLLLPWLMDLHRQDPALVIHVESLNQDLLNRRIINNTLDLAFVFDAPVYDQLEVVTVVRMPLVLVSTSEHQTPQQAVARDYLLVDWGTSFLTGHAEYFNGSAQPGMHFGNGSLALEFLLGVGGSAYLALPMVQTHLDNRRLFRLEQAPVFERVVHGVMHKNNEKQALIHRLLEALGT